VQVVISIGISVIFLITFSGLIPKDLKLQMKECLFKIHYLTYCKLSKVKN